MGLFDSFKSIISAGAQAIVSKSSYPESYFSVNPDVPCISQLPASDLRVKAYYLAARGTLPSCDYPDYANEELGGLDSYFSWAINEGFICEDMHKTIADHYNVMELKGLLSDKHLPTTGKKAELIDCLLQHTDPFKLKRIRKDLVAHTLTAQGLSFINQRHAAWCTAITAALNAVYSDDLDSAVNAFKIFDADWAFLRSNGHSQSIFLGFSVDNDRYMKLLKTKVHISQKLSDDQIKALNTFVFVYCMVSKKDIYTQELYPFGVRWLTEKTDLPVNDPRKFLEEYTKLMREENPASPLFS